MTLGQDSEEWFTVPTSPEETKSHKHKSKEASVQLISCNTQSGARPAWPILPEAVT